MHVSSLSIPSYSLIPMLSVSQLEDHDKALRILVLKLRDYEAAEQYCLLNSEGKDDATRKRLFHTLLSVYLDPNNE